MIIFFELYNIIKVDFPTKKKLKNTLSGPITGSFSVTFVGISVKIVLDKSHF